MKKTFLGLLALASIVSIANEGYFKSDTEGKFEKVSSDATTLSLEEKARVGFLLGENKDVFGFGGGSFKAATGEAVTGKFHLGLRVDTPISKHNNLTLTAAYQYMGGLEDSIKDAFKLRGEWKDAFNEDANKDDKNTFYRANGYRLEGDETVLISALVDGNYDKFEYKTGLIFNSKDFVQYHRTEALLDAKTKFDHFNVEADAAYIIGRQKHLVKTESTAAENARKLLDEGTLEGNYSGIGKLKGGLKLSYKTGAFEAYTKGNVDLGTLLPASNFDEGRYNFKVSNENVLKYEKENILAKLTAKYEGEYSLKQTKANGTVTEDKNIALHKPSLELEGKYDKNRVVAKALVKDTVFLYTKGAQLTDDNRNETIGNVFYTDDMLGYKVLDNLTLSLSGKYRLDSNFNTTANTHTHHLLVGPTLDYMSKGEKLDLTSSTGLRYLLFKDKSEAAKHSLIVFTNNNASYKLNSKLTLDGGLNSTVLYDILDKRVGLFGDALAKLTYMHDEKLTLSTALEGKVVYAYDGSETDEASKHNVAYKVVNKNEVGYQADSHIKLTGGLDVSYSHDISSDLGYTVGSRLVKEVFDADGVVSIKDYETKKISEQTEKFGDNKKVLDVTPKIGLEFKYLEERLLVKPELQVTLRHSVTKTAYTTNNASKLMYDKVSGKGTLKVEYKW